jgi:hypothetical protein
MKQPLSINIDSEFIRPLRKAQNEFVQVLLSSFSIRQGNKGLVLEVEFDNESLAVWLRDGKTYIHKQLDQALINRYQHELESILIGHEKKDWKHNDPRFPFRFGNGGTLPVIRYGDKDYYCLFYREIPPIGWNIANGGAESTSELLDPLATIERELREELIIVDLENKYRYVFDWNEGRRPDHPDFAIARRVWDEIFKRQDYLQFNDRALPLKWLSGHDSVIINFPNEKLIENSGCFLNINAEDFGIEIDRVAKMVVDPKTILCDGELVDRKLLNRVIGLFEVHRFHASMAGGKTEFLPDFIFHNGQNYSNDNIQLVVSKYFDYVIKHGIRELDVHQQWAASPYKFVLCPVTRNLIRRYLLIEHENYPDNSPYVTDSSASIEVFLSYASEDLPLAQKVYSYLQNSGRNVFFSNETIHQADFGDAVDKALQTAKSLVVVGTETDRFFKPWVRYEWQSFHNDILAKRKPWHTPLITFTAKPDKNSLPRPLVFRQIIDYEEKSFDESLHKLNSMLS